MFGSARATLYILMAISNEKKGSMSKPSQRKTDRRRKRETEKRKRTSLHAKRKQATSEFPDWHLEPDDAPEYFVKAIKDAVKEISLNHRKVLDSYKRPIAHGSSIHCPVNIGSIFREATEIGFPLAFGNLRKQASERGMPCDVLHGIAALQFADVLYSRLQADLLKDVSPFHIVAVHHGQPHKRAFTIRFESLKSEKLLGAVCTIPADVLASILEMEDALSGFPAMQCNESANDVLTEPRRMNRRTRRSITWSSASTSRCSLQRKLVPNVPSRRPMKVAIRPTLESSHFTSSLTMWTDFTNTRSKCLARLRRIVAILCESVIVHAPSTRTSLWHTRSCTQGCGAPLSDKFSTAPTFLAILSKSTSGRSNSLHTGLRVKMRGPNS